MDIGANIFAPEISGLESSGDKNELPILAISAFVLFSSGLNAPPSDFVADQLRSAFTWKKWNELEDGCPQGPEVGYSPLGVAGGLSRIGTKLCAIAKLAKENGGKVWILIYPWPAQLRHESIVFDWEKFIRNLCAQIQCEGVIDTIPKSRPNSDWYRRFYIAGDVHFNKAGNELIANELLNALTK